jgi:hypothetical protein
MLNRIVALTSRPSMALIEDAIGVFLLFALLVAGLSVPSFV